MWQVRRDVRVRVAITGRVQGVGFRFHTTRQASERSLSGWVRNCADGGVEAEFQGDEERVSEMVAWCRRGPVAASVSHVEVVNCDEVTGESGFRVRT